MRGRITGHSPKSSALQSSRSLLCDVNVIHSAWHLKFYLRAQESNRFGAGGHQPSDTDTLKPDGPPSSIQSEMAHNPEVFFRSRDESGICDCCQGGGFGLCRYPVPCEASCCRISRNVHLVAVLFNGRSHYSEGRRKRKILHSYQGFKRINHSEKPRDCSGMPSYFRF